MLIRSALAHLASLIVAAGLGAGVVLWHHRLPPVGTVAEAAPAAVVKDVAKETVTPKKVVAYQAPAKALLNLPKSAQDDAGKVVTSAVGIKADWRPRIVTSVLDTETGETKTYTTREPAPWLTADFTGEAGISIGQRAGSRIARLEVRQSLFDVKDIKVGAVASLDQPLGGSGRADAYVGIGAWYRW